MKVKFNKLRILQEGKLCPGMAGFLTSCSLFRRSLNLYTPGKDYQGKVGTVFERKVPIESHYPRSIT